MFLFDSVFASLFVCLSVGLISRLSSLFRCGVGWRPVPPGVGSRTPTWRSLAKSGQSR